MESNKIRKLEELVINRIAAGEVVQRPSAAIKELVENSLDAGSTNISITIKGGGLQLMQIQDNGHGIRKEDLSIVCERFTTSKLTTFDDLKTISTFGFRGEALASITHVSHVTILTKTANSPCAFKCKYSDGKLIPIKLGEKAEPKPCAGTIGKNASSDFDIDLTVRYAIHYSNKNISFTCKKQNQSNPDLHTQSSSSIIENIKLLYDVNIARELIDLNTSYQYESHFHNNSNDTQQLSNQNYDVKLTGKITNANYSNRKSVFILFINNRLVESNSIKKVIDQIYFEILPKHSHPFVYLSLE
eukprot:gene11959-16007_t